MDTMYRYATTQPKQQYLGGDIKMKQIFVAKIMLLVLAISVIGIGTGITVQQAHADTGINIHGNYNPNCIHHCGGDYGGNGDNPPDDGGTDNGNGN
ncbi:MAG: hypothetical protein WBE68_01720 [Candidatus Nitrosopolaris sp.]